MSSSGDSGDSGDGIGETGMYVYERRIVKYDTLPTKENSPLSPLSPLSEFAFCLPMGGYSAPTVAAREAARL